MANQRQRTDIVSQCPCCRKNRNSMLAVPAIRMSMACFRRLSAFPASCNSSKRACTSFSTPSVTGQPITVPTVRPGRLVPPPFRSPRDRQDHLARQALSRGPDIELALPGCPSATAGPPGALGGMGRGGTGERDLRDRRSPTGSGIAGCRSQVAGRTSLPPVRADGVQCAEAQADGGGTCLQAGRCNASATRFSPARWDAIFRLCGP